MLCFFLLLKKPPLILAAEHSRGLCRSQAEPGVCILRASVSPLQLLGVGEEKHCWAVVRAVRSWGQCSAPLQVEHSLGPGWIFRGEKSSTSKAAAQREFLSH